MFQGWYNKCMMYALKLYLISYNFFNLCWTRFFEQVGKLCLVYHIDEENKPNNITINYYSGIGLAKYNSGKYHVKIYDIHGTSNILFEGHIHHIHKLKSSTNHENPPKRKNIMLSNNDTSLGHNLSIIDKYKQNMKLVEKPITNLGEILKYLGIKCTHLTIVELRPLKRETFSIDEITIDDIYY